MDVGAEEETSAARQTTAARNPTATKRIIKRTFHLSYHSPIARRMVSCSPRPADATSLSRACFNRFRRLSYPDSLLEHPNRIEASPRSTVCSSSGAPARLVARSIPASWLPRVQRTELEEGKAVFQFWAKPSVARLRKVNDSGCLNAYIPTMTI